MSLPFEQARVLLAMLLCGAVLGAACDGLNLLHRICFRDALSRLAVDLSVGPLCAAGMIKAALFMHTEVMRWYTLLGMLGGLYLYRVSLGALVRCIFASAGRFCEKIFARNRNKKK